MKSLASQLKMPSFWALLSIFIILTKSYSQVDQEPEFVSAEGCLNDYFSQELTEYRNKVIQRSASRILSRSSTPDYDLNIYIDTSYERRRTGGYNNNGAIISYLSGIISNVRTDFNSAAPNWDLNISVSFNFFDGETPFPYGGTISETFFNFYDWVEGQGFPGSDDNYVFYTGNYTNQGISFVGALCVPGGSLVGFVANEDPNEDLSAHEWMGHTSGSPHFSGTTIIMNPVAKRPWLAASLDTIESFLDNSQTCVDNVQIPLANEFDLFDITRVEDKVHIECRLNQFSKEVKLQRQFIQGIWETIGVKHQIQANENLIWVDQPLNSGTYYYQVLAKDESGYETASMIKSIEWKQQNWSLQYPYITNPQKERLEFYSVIGDLLFTSNEAFIHVSRMGNPGIYLVRSKSQSTKFVLPH